MKYTFLLPAYKTQYLQNTLYSILSQTYSNFKIIVSDDCSPEDIQSVVEHFSDVRISFQKNIRNIGGENLVEHWNNLVMQCDTEYFIMASDDDVYDKNFLERIDKLTVKYPQVDCLRARCQRIDRNSEIIAQEDIFDEYQIELRAIHSMFCSNYIGCIGNYVFKTIALKKVKGFVKLPYAWFSDLLSVISVLENGQANTNEILFDFRLSENNISNTIQNRYMDQRKLKATIDFDIWLSVYMNKISFQSSILNENQLMEIISNFKHRVYNQCGDYSWSIPIWKWCGVYRRLKKNAFFSRSSYLKYFFIAVANWKLRKFI